MDDFKEIKELLRPRRDIKASDEMRLKVIRAVEGKTEKTSSENGFSAE